MYGHLVFAKMCENSWILNLSLVNKEICFISFVIFLTFAMEEDITEEQWVILDIIASEIEHPCDIIQSGHEHHAAALAHL
jgi:hypothetical protein